MAKSVSHPISTRDSNIRQRAEGLRADIGQETLDDFISHNQTNLTSKIFHKRKKNSNIKKSLKT